MLVVGGVNGCVCCSTKLERDKSEDFHQRKERAERLAMQIEGQDSVSYAVGV